MSEQQERRRRPYAARVPLLERREQLLDAALRVINTEGYAALTIARIADEAGVTRPVVYGAFEDLDTLSVTLLDRTQRRAVDQVVGVLAPLLKPGADLAGWAPGGVRQLVDVVRADQETWRPILTRLPGTPPVVSDRIEQSRSAIKAIIAQVIDRSLGGGTGPRIDPVIGAHAALGALEEMGRLLLRDPEGFDVEAAVVSVTVLLDALTRSEA